MALTQLTVVNTAVDILQQFGLADLSMRRLAKELDVQVGALYWHVKNKQELLAQVAAQLLNTEPLRVNAEHFSSPADAVLQLSRNLYLALLPIQDSPEVIEVATALQVKELNPMLQLRELLVSAGLSVEHARFGQQLLLNHVLGSVAYRQNLVQLDVDAPQADGFDWGLRCAITGLFKEA
ncbi:TetR family transcriptional regulator [Arthrobacter sp. MYb211]|uniref:TetR family transcriptional regulator n=1 Tax=unclassified Arthrobacter TaxID=235627 RepID=UPI000CFAC59D|nr:MULTISPECIES: TetR family transcriptional regulator [unclassified Arthrobacter]PRA11945.1 TetR family transcriptional regulator [Arthrobacter sp. MYb221]PRC08300.1 TetR family transcriptional regulator [Arthrobacter sp. MYb211]